jgi:hypothetical protein
MKLTGLPSPRRLIMMFRPAFLTSHSAFWDGSSVRGTTAFGSPSSPLRSSSRDSCASSGESSGPANSTSRIAAGCPISADSITGRKAGLARARSIIVRSTSSTAVGPSLTMCCAESIAR